MGVVIVFIDSGKGLGCVESLVNDPKPREPANEFTNAGSGRATAPALLLLQRCFDSARSAPGRAAVAASVGVPPATPTVPTHPSRRFAPLQHRQDARLCRGTASAVRNLLAGLARSGSSPM
jgi:hypothetical protein